MLGLGPGWTKSDQDAKIGLAVALLLFLVGLIQAGEMFLKNEFTTQGLILIALSGTSVALLTWTEFRRRWPLKMKFDTQPYVTDKDREFFKLAKIGIGKTKLNIVLRPRALLNVKSLDIRFVERGFPKWLNAWGRQIRIISVAIPQWEGEANDDRDFVGPNFIKKTENGVGGWIISPTRRKLWTAGDELYVEIEAEAEAPWTGHLSILCRSEGRTYSRRTVRVRR